MSNQSAVRTAAHFAARRVGVPVDVARDIADAALCAVEPVSGRESRAYWALAVRRASDLADAIASAIAKGDFTLSDHAHDISDYEDEAWAAGDETAALVANVARQHGRPLVHMAARHLVGEWQSNWEAT